MLPARKPLNRVEEAERRETSARFNFCARMRLLNLERVGTFLDMASRESSSITGLQIWQFVAQQHLNQNDS